MICLTVKIRFSNHETARHGSRNMRYSRYMIPSYMRVSKRFNISKHIIERNVKNDDSIVKITHIHIHIYSHTHT